MMMLNPMKRMLLPLALMIANSQSASVSQDDGQKYTDALIAWLRSEKGYLSSKLEMRRLDPNDENSRFGMFTTRDIAENELMIRVPRNIILSSDLGEPTYTAMECETIRSLAKELNLGDDSKYAPYVNYLKETQPPGQLPSAWSKAGKDLLWQSITAMNGEQILPPEDPVGWLDHEWTDLCNGSNDPMEEYAALLVVQRSWDNLLIPVYDMMSHRNGYWLNTKSNNVHDDTPVKVTALRDIAAGEEIYTTYNFCADCENRMRNYGTPEILRDYGFVENFPQSWIFHDIGVGFRIDERYDENGEMTGDVDLVEWIEGVPDADSMHILALHLEQVIEKKKDLAFRHPKVPFHEWKTISDYIKAMEVAINVAIPAYEQAVNEVEGLPSCAETGDCDFSLDRYTNLDNSYNTVTNSEYTCDVSETFGVMHEDPWEILETIKSPYQTIGFLMDVSNRDTCMDLDDIVQICDSYRPHYHEMVVHYTARFRDSIKRVLFVGGGDSMLLHEIIKYPSLELVVGLEIDQRVTRGSFKHFGTQPHYDNEKVEWWYGDASKSLLMLPKSYFGSFDMVLVDLSETVMSFKVTEGLDVLEALTLLMKEEGIFVKNEVYFEKFREMFPFSTQIHWYDNPVICSQLLALGSRSVNFMNAPLTDHKVDGLFIRSFDEIDDHYDLYHDYAHNSTETTSHQLCNNVGDKNDNMSTKQESSPGIVLIVEAEDTTVDLGNTDSLSHILTNALEQEGLNVVSKFAESSDIDSITTIVLKEGYVIARCTPAMNYCGFDIHFWSSFERHENAKNALVTAVGSNASSMSSFRIIAGGLFGVPSWKEDEKSRGPQFHELCESFTSAEDDAVSVGDTQYSIVDKVLAGSFELSKTENHKVAMLVGSGSTLTEKSRNKILSIEKVNEVATLSCPSMAGFNEFAENASAALTACEKDLYEAMALNTADAKFDAIVIDSSADKVTASILLKILSSRNMSNMMFESEMLALSVFTEEDEEWRRNFLKLFKDKGLIQEPANYAEVFFHDDESAFMLLIAKDGDEHFYQTLNSVLPNLEKESGMKTDVQLVSGGMWKFQEDFVPTNHFLPDDFDQTSPLKQWKSQQPLGFQIVFQMQIEEEKTQLSNDIVKKAIDSAVSKSKYFVGKTQKVGEFTNLGDGSINIAITSVSSIVVLWDGRSHIDVNYFTFDEDVEEANAFESSFKASIESLTTVLRDEQPRGVGRVVSYRRDIEGTADPHWA